MNYLGTSINESPVSAFPAGKDMTDIRGKAVMLDENGQVVLTESGKPVLGVAVLENPESVTTGDTVTVQTKDIGYVKAGTDVKSGDALTTDADGAFIPATSGSYCAIALENGAKDTFIPAILRGGSL